MPRLLANRFAQTVLVAEFSFGHNDWVIDSADGVKRTLGSTVALSRDPLEPGLTGAAAATVVFDALPLPGGVVLVGGELIVETPYAGPTAATVSLGIAGNTAALLNASNLMAAAGTRTALTLTTTPLISNASGANLRATIAYTVANATAGRARLRVMYTIDGRANENVGA